jgi:hypothetical protein
MNYHRLVILDDVAYNLKHTNLKIFIILLLLLFTAIGFSPGGSSPYTSTHNTNVFTRWQ